MGYEVKLFVVSETVQCTDKFSILNGKPFSAYHNEDTGWYGYLEDDTKILLPEPTIELSHTLLFAMINLSKPGYDSGVYALTQTAAMTTSYFYTEGHAVIFDSYGDRLKEVCKDQMLQTLEKDYEDTKYRRFKSAIALLKSFDKEDYPEGVKVLLYGY